MFCNGLYLFMTDLEMLLKIFVKPNYNNFSETLFDAIFDAINTKIIIVKNTIRTFSIVNLTG